MVKTSRLTWTSHALPQGFEPMLKDRIAKSVVPSQLYLQSLSIILTIEHRFGTMEVILASPSHACFVSRRTQKSEITVPPLETQLAHFLDLSAFWVCNSIIWFVRRTSKDAFYTTSSIAGIDAKNAPELNGSLHLWVLWEWRGAEVVWGRLPEILTYMRQVNMAIPQQKWNC